MAVKVFINGAIVDEADARISVFDRGFLYGDSVYEVMRTSGGRCVDLHPHLRRLARSADALALELPDLSVLADQIQTTLEAAENPESYVRVVVTRGAGRIGLDTQLASEPVTIVIVRPLELPPAELYRTGASLEIVEVQRTSRRAMDPSVKSGNYLNNILALHEAKRAGAYEALMCDARGRVAEGSSSNVFVVRGGKIATPAQDIGLLAGITRQAVIDLARGDGIAVDEGTLRPDDVRGADEVFITSSIRGVLPITRVDGEPVANGEIGEVTRRVMSLYGRHLQEAGA